MNKNDYKKIKNFTFKSEFYPREVALSEVATWAIWDENDKYNTKIIEQSLEKLKTNTVFVALNFAGDDSKLYLDEPFWKEWQNFHGDRTQTDKKLCGMLQNTKYEGSYITDLLKLVPTKSSLELRDKIKNSEIDLEAQVNLFIQELEILQTDDIELYLMGYETERIFKKYFYKSVEQKIKSYKRILHTSNYHGSNEDFYKKVREQLEL
ncbi:hypothetical protein [Lactococcus formosensis]|uniref:hypothetical protein n=1 Tax=Lactococcus formosensis TaxID=1281486 RepID=UPI0013FDEE09|nr:hypothetical protein [Lactococcus formosensis]NHI68167.1 hypothetical protein [Lactococcus garvieae]NHJ18844.1 hypothetical protein [Lactococcus garvieae]